MPLGLGFGFCSFGVWQNVHVIPQYVGNEKGSLMTGYALSNVEVGGSNAGFTTYPFFFVGFSEGFYAMPQVGIFLFVSKERWFYLRRL